MHDIYTKLGSIPDLFPFLRDFGPQPLPDFSQEPPPWIEETKVEEHKQVECRLNEADEKDKYFRSVEHILWGTGDHLEESIHLVLEDLGLTVRHTPKGSTVDRIAEIPGSELVFGFEITGLNDGIKKKSNKIGQALTFLQERDGAEKPVILADTFNDRPLDERRKEADFTPEALQLMEPNGIVGMTTMTLYEVWKAVKYGDTDMKAVAEEIYRHRGGQFEFAPAKT